MGLSCTGMYRISIKIASQTMEVLSRHSVVLLSQAVDLSPTVLININTLVHFHTFCLYIYISTCIAQHVQISKVPTHVYSLYATQLPGK